MQQAQLRSQDRWVAQGTMGDSLGQRGRLVRGSCSRKCFQQPGHALQVVEGNPLGRPLGQNRSLYLGPCAMQQAQLRSQDRWVAQGTMGDSLGQRGRLVRGSCPKVLPATWPRPPGCRGEPARPPAWPEPQPDR